MNNITPIHYTLYKNPVQTDTLAIVRYLYHHNIFLLPKVVIERGFPANLRLPAIYDHDKNELYEGIEGCVSFYERHSLVQDLQDKATAFARDHPSYTIQ